VDFLAHDSFTGLHRLLVDLQLLFMRLTVLPVVVLVELVAPVARLVEAVVLPVALELCVLEVL